jgi:hypothetical protein
VDMFEQRCNEFNDSFEESVSENNEMTLEEFLRYELIFSWEKRIFEDEEFISDWNDRNK